jgi:membrane-bound lytic murein transglycosylase MltF
MRRLLVSLLFVPALAGTARAEIAVLSNGLTLKLDRHRVEEGQVLLVLRGGGELGVPASLVRGFVPDEVLDELDVPGADLRALAVAAAHKHGLDPGLVLAVVSVESGFRSQAVSPKGAQGLMQLMPKTAAELGVGDALDPQQNLDGGVRHLGSLLTLYDGDVRRALAAYNAGQGAVARHNGIPPYRETQAYVEKVLRHFGSRDRQAAGDRHHGRNAAGQPATAAAAEQGEPGRARRAR